MPIYEYQCDGCGEVFEVFQKVNDAAPTQHSCGSEAVHRVLSNTSFVLKGTGWYATDYAQKSTGGDTGSKSSSKAAKSDSASTSAKTDTAPAASKDSAPKKTAS